MSTPAAPDADARALDGARVLFNSEVFSAAPRTAGPATDLGHVDEPARATPVHAECEVLVVGGGPAGTAAAIGAARAGARVLLLERYNHLGGLSTGGLVIWIDRMTDWDGTPLIAGIGQELLDRLPPAAVCGPPRADWGSRDAATAGYWQQRLAAFHGITTWSPMIDPEHLKTVSQEALLEAGAGLLLHAWGTRPLLDAGRVAGAIFESKQGRRAVRAQVTIDATGDGDLFSQAGCAFDDDINAADIHHCMNTSWLFGGVDMPRWLAFRYGEPAAYAEFMAAGRVALAPLGGMFEKPFTSWRDDVAVFMGPRQSGRSAVDVADITQVEIASRRLMHAHLGFYRSHAAGFGTAHVMTMAPQLGVRHSRRLRGLARVARSDWRAMDAAPLIHADEIGVSPSLSPVYQRVSVPWRALVPAGVTGLLAPGRHLSCDANSHAFLREIPQCWMTGQAAGVGAALAVRLGCELRDVPAAALQSALRAQGVTLRDAQTDAAAPSHPAVTADEAVAAGVAGPPTSTGPVGRAPSAV